MAGAQVSHPLKFTGIPDVTIFEATGNTTNIRKNYWIDTLFACLAAFLFFSTAQMKHTALLLSARPFLCPNSSLSGLI